MTQPQFSTGPKPVINNQKDFVRVKATDNSLKQWAKDAQELMVEWYPKIERILKVKVERHPKTVYLLITTHGDGVAGTSNRRIEVNGDYVRNHMSDIGLIVHELTHVVQSYPPNDPGWLVEGIADYVRWFNYEPVSAQPHPNPARIDYHHGYREVAAFLNWAVIKYDRNLVSKLNTDLAKGKYSDASWTVPTKHSFKELWDEYVASLQIKS